MNGDQQSRFLHLNRDGRWLGLRTAGLELGGDGLLRLASLPLLTGSPPEGLAELDAPSGPAGIAVGPDGTRYWSDPAGHRLLADGPCAGDAGPVCCVGGEGGRPTQLRLPRGVCFHRLRRALLVADSGNHRIQLLDPGSFQLLDVWGQPDPSGEPEPGDEPGRFDTPLALADDADGSVYVVDHGNRRVQKLDLYGRPVAGFWETVRGEAGLRGPSAVAVDPRARPVRVHILDPELPALVVLDEHGHLLQTVRPALTAEAMGLAVARGAVYAGDNGLRRVRKWEPDGTPTGEARGYAGPVAGLAFDARADLLLVHPGDGAAPVELARTGAHASRGILWGGPFANTSIRPEQWHQLTAAVEPLGPGAHLRLLTAADTGAPPPVDPAADEPFAAPAWQPLPPDVTEGIFPGAPLTGLWVGAQFASAGLRCPALAQLRLDFDRDTWLPYLPPIYQRDPASRELLIRLLSLFDSLFGEVEARIGGLGVLLDPAAIPAELLGWLAGRLALELPDDLAEADRRRLIAEVFDLYARRGTVQGLSAALRRSGGVDARIAEPILHAAWWSLAPDTAAPVEAAASVLGLSTMLAPAEAQGAVVGTTAVLDQSHLISGEEFGLPLFEDVAHQFSVAVYRGPHYSDEALGAVRATLDREKPAHTAYHLCLIEPRMRVGFQATLGVDSVVAGPAGPTLLGATTPGGADLVLGGTPPGRIGEDRVGRTTRLGDATVRA
jgi:phage tail-like protein